MNDGSLAVLTALFERIVPTRDGLFRLIGPIGPSEYAALRAIADPSFYPAITPDLVATPIALPRMDLDPAVLTAAPVRDGRICIDFGTAASKIAFDLGGDRFEPLAVGLDDGDDPFWVRSAIAIDAQGAMIFGRRAQRAGQQSSLPVVRSFKSKLWGDPATLDAPALEHAGIAFSYRDCIQAYLAFLTHLGATRLIEQGVSRYTPRRYAMPFAYDEQRRHIRAELGRMVDRAVVLADTLDGELTAGVPVARMRAALDAAAAIDVPGWLLADPACVGEPVAVGAFAMDEEIGALTVYMIADVGAGTTDFCILCLKKQADGDLEPIQIRNGALSIEIAGDAVDAALVDYLVQEPGGRSASYPACGGCARNQGTAVRCGNARRRKVRSRTARTDSAGCQSSGSHRQRAVAQIR